LTELYTFIADIHRSRACNQSIDLILIFTTK
jgi:hypothetical protein